MSQNRPLDVSNYIRIGGIDQWVHIRGRDAKNPLLLWLHGGPGASTVPYWNRYDSWEQFFTIVMWDQRGTGRTFERHGASLATTMHARQMATDGIELTEYLYHRFSGVPITLLGHSWGSILGIQMISRRPELFAAYVGTGQVTHYKRQLEVGYPLLLQRAAALRMSVAIDELLGAGPPNAENGPRAYAVASKWASMLEIAASTLGPLIVTPTVEKPSDSFFEGSQFSRRLLSRELAHTDLTMRIAFSIPVHFFQGTEDLLTPTSVVRSYFDKVVAPYKTFATIPHAGHSSIFSAPRQFLSELLTRVYPMVVAKSPRVSPRVAGDMMSDARP